MSTSTQPIQFAWTALGAFLNAMRHRIFREIEDSLCRLRANYIDIDQLPCPRSAHLYRRDR